VLIDGTYARVLWLQGLSDQAMRLTESLVDYARSNDHGLSFLQTLIFTACPVALWVGDLTTADRHMRLAFDLAARHGDLESLGAVLRGDTGDQARASSRWLRIAPVGS
jgi:hypothetical protein